MTNYTKICNMEVYEMANWYCRKFINGFSFFSRSQRAEIVEAVISWLNEEAIDFE